MSGSPSDEYRRTFSPDSASLAGLEISSTGSVSGGSGLGALARQLSNEFGVTADGGPSRMWWLRHHGQRGDSTGDRSTDPNVVLSVSSHEDLNTNASDAEVALLPLSMDHESESSFTVRIPQDVESHQSSVDIEHVDDGTSLLMIEAAKNADSGPITALLRVGMVDVASTPLATTPALRLSLMGDVHRGHSQDSLTLGNYGADRASASSASTGDATDNDHDHDGGHNDDDNDDNDNDNEEEEVEEEEEEDSTLPPLRVMSSSSQQTRSSGGLLRPQSVPHSAAMTEATRSSYMTNDTGTASRISGLSDFPVPPNQTVVSLDRVEVLKSYFANDTQEPSEPAGQDAPAAAAMPLEEPSLAGPSQPSRERSSADGEPEHH